MKKCEMAQSIIKEAHGNTWVITNFKDKAKDSSKYKSSPNLRFYGKKRGVKWGGKI